MVFGRCVVYFFVNGIDYLFYKRGYNVVVVDVEIGIMFCRYFWYIFIKSEMENGFNMLF